MKYTINDTKFFPKTNGVYKISFTNSINGKVYIGSASGGYGFYTRWKSHISSLKNKKSGNTILQLATNKYDLSNIIFEVLEFCEKDDCLNREQFYIDKYNSYNYGYNGRPKSSNNGCLPMKKVTKDKISDKWKIKRDFYVGEVRRLYINENKNTREISDILNISRTFIQKIFKENEIEPRKNFGLQKVRFYQYKDGILIKEWDSINDCVIRNSFNSNGIRIVLNGQCFFYKNFHFNYLKPHILFSSTNISDAFSTLGLSINLSKCIFLISLINYLTSTLL